MRVVIESPLAGDFALNFRFLLWCCRAVWIKEGAYAIASHLICPWFFDDTNEIERAIGMQNEWVWGSKTGHVAFLDLGESEGMKAALKRCAASGIWCDKRLLREYAPSCWAAFERGEWPPATPGFKLADSEAKTPHAEPKP